MSKVGANNTWKWLATLPVLAGFLVIVFFTPREAKALPIFARKYKTSCSTCHTLIPKLNQFGIAFRNNGYRIPVNDEKFLKEQDVELGAPAWKTMWPKNGIWPGKISEHVPIALRGVLDTNIKTSGNVKLNFDFPNEFAMYMAGTLGDSLSFLGEVEFKGGGGPPPGGTERIELSLMQLNFNRLWGTNLLNLRIGRFEPIATPFSRFWRRTTSADFNVSEFRPVSGISTAQFRDRQMGVELYGARTGLDNRGGLEWGIGVVNGTGTLGDNNSQKDFQWSASYKLFGYGVTGPLRDEPEQLASLENYKDNSFKVGMFGYVGRTPTGTTEDRYNRVGVKFDGFLGPVNLYGAYMRGRDTLIASSQLTRSSAWFLEGDYMLTPWIMPLVRFERTDATTEGGTPRPSRRLVIPAVNFLVRANVRILVESRFFLRDKDFSATQKPANEGRVRIDFLF